MWSNDRRSRAEAFMQHVDSLVRKTTRSSHCRKEKTSGVCMHLKEVSVGTQIDVIMMMLLNQLLRPKTFNKDKDVVLPGISHCSPGHDVDALPGVLPREALGEEREICLALLLRN